MTVDAAPPVVRAAQLGVTLGGRRVLDGVDLSLNPGRVLGLLGCNGAGKTTTLKVLCGLVRPDAGTVTFAGGGSGPPPRMGCLIETPGFYPKLTAAENLRLFSHDRSRAGRADIAETLDLLGLTNAGDKLVGRYSLGMRQRLGIARALLGKPPVVLLDEPTNGLDPHGIVDVRTLIRRLADQEGVAFVVSSHILGEVEQVADAVTVIDAGRTVASFDLDSADEDVYEVRVNDAGHAARELAQRWPGAACAVLESDRMTVAQVSDGPGAVNRFLVERGYWVSALVPRGSLEDRVMPYLRKGV